MMTMQLSHLQGLDVQDSGHSCLPDVSLAYERIQLAYCSSTQTVKQLTVGIKVTRTSELHILVQSSRTSCTYITGFFFVCDRAVGEDCTGTVAVIVWGAGCTISSPSSKSSITTANESLSCVAVSSFTPSSSSSPSPLSSSSSWSWSSSSSIMHVRHIMWLMEVAYLFPYIDHQSNIIMMRIIFILCFSGQYLESVITQN